MRDLFEDSLGRRLADVATPETLRSLEGRVDGTLWAALEAEDFASALADGDPANAWSDAFGLVRAMGRRPAPIPLVETMIARWILSQAGLERPEGPLSLSTNAHLALDAGRVSGTVSETPWGRAVPGVVAVLDDAVLLLPTAGTEIREALNIAGEPRDCLAFASVAPIATTRRPETLPGDIVRRALAAARAAQIAGAAEQALLMTAEYAQDRRQFGRSISAFQVIQHHLAVMAEHACAATVAADAAFRAADEGFSELLAGSAKLVANEAATQNAASAHAIHGAIGVTEEYALQHLTRRLWSWRGEAGTTRQWAERIGRLATAAGGDGLWSFLLDQAGLAPEGQTA